MSWAILNARRCIAAKIKTPTKSSSGLQKAGIEV